MQQTLAQLLEAAEAAEKDGQLIEALRAYRAALQLERRCEPAALGMGRLCLLFERYEDALIEFTGVLLRNTLSAEAFRGRGLCYFHMGQEQRGLQDLDRAVLIEPDSVEVRLSRGQMAMSLGVFDIAEEDLRHALSLSSDDADVALELAECLLERGDARPPLTSEDLAEIKALSATAHAGLGDDALVLLIDAEVAALEGDPALARALVHTAIALDEAAETSARRRKRLLALLSQ